MVRNGLRGRKQQYKCKDCGCQFLGGIRRDKPQVISEYIEGKQTRKQLVEKYGVSVRTIERDLEGMRYVQDDKDSFTADLPWNTQRNFSTNTYHVIIDINVMNFIDYGIFIHGSS